MYKIIACDLDETLLSDDAHVSKANRFAIQKAIAKGVKFVLATGRGYVSVQDTLKEIGLDNKANEYVISFNGGCVTENRGDKVLRFVGLSYEIANKLVKLGEKYDVCIHIYTKDMLYVYGPDQDELNYLTGRHKFKVLKNLDISFLQDKEIGKVLYQNTNQTYLEKIVAELGSIVNQLDVSYSSNRYLEFNHAGVNKGVGLSWLADKLGVDIKDTIAIGDNLNDLSMLKTAGLGVGVANSNPAIIKDCRYITHANNNEGAVKEVIDQFILNN